MENFRCAPAVFYVGQVPLRPMKSYHWGEAFYYFPKMPAVKFIEQALPLSDMDVCNTRVLCMLF